MWIIIAVVVGIVGVLSYYLMSPKQSESVGITSVLAKTDNPASAEAQISSYRNFFSSSISEDSSLVERRKSQYVDVVNGYYDLATDFYEYGWGTSFHFASRCNGETLRESIKRHEHYLAKRMGLQKGQTAIDVGCGVGGPLIEIARFTGAKITGINNNDYQIRRGQHHLAQAELSDSCGFIKGDFLNMPVADEAFDACYTIEACCHAPSRVEVFSEVFRVLKPGGVFAGYEWVMTDNFNPSDDEHVAIKKGIEQGNGLPDLASNPEIVLSALREAGFEITSSEDKAVLTRQSDVPWFEPLAGRWSLANFRVTKLGQWLTHAMLIVLEKVRFVPKGAVDTHLMLAEGASALVEGGKRQLFTPMFLFVARKPYAAASVKPL